MLLLLLLLLIVVVLCCVVVVVGCCCCCGLASGFNFLVLQVKALHPSLQTETFFAFSFCIIILLFE